VYVPLLQTVRAFRSRFLPFFFLSFLHGGQFLGRVGSCGVSIVPGFPGRGGGAPSCKSNPVPIGSVNSGFVNVSGFAFGFGEGLPVPGRGFPDGFWPGPVNGSANKSGSPVGGRVFGLFCGLGKSPGRVLGNGSPSGSATGQSNGNAIGRGLSFGAGLPFGFGSVFGGT